MLDPVAYALTGETIQPDGGQLLDRLRMAGWDAERIRQFRDERIAAGEPWPLPVDPAWLNQGFAAFSTRLAAAREGLGLGTSHVVPPATPRPLDPDERRLSQDRPPHWG